MVAKCPDALAGAIEAEGGKGGKGGTIGYQPTPGGPVKTLDQLTQSVLPKSGKQAQMQP
jgi:hypothetical protein